MIEKLKIIAGMYMKENINNPILYKKYQLIEKILNKKDCFLKMDIEYAYSILRDLQIPENEIKMIYSELI